MASMIDKPGQDHSYSPGYFSRLERGSASSQLFVYLAIAEIFNISAGRLLGPDDVEKDVTDAELTLVRLVRRLGIPVEEAIERIVASGHAAAAGGAEAAARGAEAAAGGA